MANKNELLKDIAVALGATVTDKDNDTNELLALIRDNIQGGGGSAGGGSKLYRHDFIITTPHTGVDHVELYFSVYDTNPDNIDLQRLIGGGEETLQPFVQKYGLLNKCITWCEKSEVLPTVFMPVVLTEFYYDGGLCFTVYLNSTDEEMAMGHPRTRSHSYDGGEGCTVTETVTEL